MQKFFESIFEKIKIRLFTKSLKRRYFLLFDKGAYKEAYDLYRRIVNDHPKWLTKGDPYVTFAKLEFLANQDNDAALKLLEKANDLGCTNKPAYYCVLGQVYWRKEEIEKGIQNLQKCVELEDSIAYLKSYGNLLSYAHDKRAVDVWEKILKRDPMNPVALAYLGIEASRAGNQEQAHILAEKAENLVQSKDDFLEIGRMYFRENQFKNALHYYLKCEELDFKTHSILYDEISICYSKLEDYRLATLYAGKALKVHFNDE